MKIIAIVSSPRKNSDTGILAKAVLEGANSEGSETEYIQLNEQHIEFCKGCLGCMRTGQCPIEDDFEMLKKKIEEADGIVIGSPTYMSTYNAELKRFFERFGLYEHMTSESFGGKYFVAVTAGGGTTGDTLKALSSKQGVYGRGYVCGTYGLAVKDKKASEYPDSLEACRALGKKMVGDIKDKKTFPMQNLGLRIINKLFVRPNMSRFIIEKKDGIYKAIYESLNRQGVL